MMVFSGALKIAGEPTPFPPPLKPRTASRDGASLLAAFDLSAIIANNEGLMPSTVGWLVV